MAFLQSARREGLISGDLATTLLNFHTRARVAAEHQSTVGSVGSTQSPLRGLSVEDVGTPQGIAAWTLVSSTMLIPMVILVLVYPNIVAP